MHSVSLLEPAQAPCITGQPVEHASSTAGHSVSLAHQRPRRQTPAFAALGPESALGCSRPKDRLDTHSAINFRQLGTDARGAPAGPASNPLSQERMHLYDIFGESGLGTSNVPPPGHGRHSTWTQNARQ